MRKLFIIGAAAAALAIATPAAADDEGVIVGGAAGGATGGTIGFLIGGPLGAIVGGWTGAAIGASVLSDDVRFDRGGSIDVDADLTVGVVVDDDIRLRPIEGEDRFGYFRSNGYVYVVDVDTREVVEIRLG